MSKAFTRESEDLPEVPAFPRRPSPLPPGAKNYFTPDGAERLRGELARLAEEERPRLAAMPADSDTKRQLQSLDQKIAHLTQSLESAVVVSRSAAPEDRVRFGATVTVREQSGEEARYRIVGVDEADIDRGWISWVSPIAKALLNARLGERVAFKFPSGEAVLEVLCITYE